MEFRHHLRTARPYALVLTALCAALCSSIAGVAAQAPPAIDTSRLRVDARTLAHDSLQGRATGSPGARRAAEYIAGRLHMLGLRAPGRAFLEPVPIERVRLGPGTTLTLSRGDGSVRFDAGAEFLLTGGRSALRDVEGDVVLLGLASHATAAQPAAMAGRLVAIAGTIGAEAERLVPQLRAAGAAAIVQLVPDADAFGALRESQSSPLVGDAGIDDPVWQPALPVVTAGPALTRAILSGVPIPHLDSTLPFEPAETNARVALRLDATFEPVEAFNVAGIVAGTDPLRADTFVAFIAHYDHLGTGVADTRGDTIYNGFSDNAAGVAMLLAIADALVRSPPAHSTLFLFFTGEERGLLGSAHWTMAPSVPLERIAAVINLDGGAPPRPPISWRIAGGLDQPLGEVARSVAMRHGWSVNLTAASPNSDHWPFQRRGVPTVFIIPGNEWQDTSEAERDALRARWNRYHQPGDEYADDYPFAGIARYAAFALEVGLAAARR